MNKDPNNYFQIQQIFQNKERKYEKQIDDLESQLANIKRENEELKQKLKEMNEKQNTLVPEHQYHKISPETNGFDIIQDIVIGTNCKYVKVLDKTVYVLKEMIDHDSSIQRLIDEYEIMRELNHQNILKAYKIIINDKNFRPSILLEYCPTNLEQAIQNGTLSKVQKVFTIYQIAEGMKYLHLQRIVHQNLKPSKILISECQTIKIGGFDKSQISNLKTPTNEEKLNEMADIRAFGDIIYFILSGGKFTKIKNDTVLEFFPLLAKQLVDACWHVDSQSGPTFEIICDVLEKNNFNLVSLSQQEIQEVSQMIVEYKELISI